MYDVETHMRFVRSATDAWFNYASAAIAAFGAWQEHVSEQIKVEPVSPPKPPPTPYEQAWTWWSDVLFPVAEAPVKPKPADFGAPFFQFAPALQNVPVALDTSTLFNPFNINPFNFNPFSALASPGALSGNPWAQSWMDMATAYSRAMPQFSWTAFQGPMTAWLMAAGLPYAVAAPTARGNAATMDAALAARQNLDNIYSSFRTDGGHAIAPILSTIQPMAMLLAPYWPMPSKRVH